MMRKTAVFLMGAVIFAGLFIRAPYRAYAADPVISNVTIDPLLDVSLFGRYNIYADISDFDTGESASLVINTLNGNDGDGDPWDYYADGTPASSPIYLNMTWQSGTTWKSQNIYPDNIYPEIFFAPSSVTHNNAPLNISTRRNNYHLLHLNNPFTMTGSMSFWIEVNAVPVSTINSADMQVYLVKRDKQISFFNSDWRNSADVELVGTLTKNAVFHHTHTVNSGHHLIGLSTNPDGTVGIKNLDVSGDFWIVFYNTSPNTARGWSLRYQPPALCTNTNRWYIGDFSGWTTTAQSGCPDSHIHVARRDANKDGVKADITAAPTTLSTTFYFNTPVNLAPNATSFTNPLAGAHSGQMNIQWDPASDPNDDTVTYNIYLQNTGGDDLATLVSLYNNTSTMWDTTSVPDGLYRLKGEVCDGELCTDFFSENFSVLNDPATTIYSLSSVSLYSSNQNQDIARTGDIITLLFSADGVIGTPEVVFYSGGESVFATPTTVNTAGNTWSSTYTVNQSDSSGTVSFVISSTNLDSNYYQTTDGSRVTVNTTSDSVTETGGSTAVSQNSTPPRCGDTKPGNIPDLFQIDVVSSRATVHFTPVNDNNSGYYISYSEQSGVFEHGAQFSYGYSSGAVTYSIDHLKPSATYYFKVRGHNGCMPGEWSNEMKMHTGKAGDSREVKYYKNIFVQLYSEIVTYIRKPDPQKKKQTEVIPTSVPEVSDKKIPPLEKPKKCFLWWCY